MKGIAVALALWFLSNRGWRLLFGGSATDGAGGTSTSGSGSGSAGGLTIGADGGVYEVSGGAGGSSNYAELAAAIAALAAGTRLPNIQSKTIAGVSGSNVIIAGEGGKAVRVLAYAVTSSGANNARFRSGGAVTDLWRVDLDAPAGKSGANLATAWPGYLFSSNPGDALNIQLDGAASVSVTYWQETD